MSPLILPFMKFYKTTKTKHASFFNVLKRNRGITRHTTNNVIFKKKTHFLTLFLKVRVNLMKQV